MSALPELPDIPMAPVVATQSNPNGAQSEPSGFADTDVANAVRLATRYGESIRYTTAAGWLVWDGKRWSEDERDVNIQGLAKDTAVAIFDEIKDAPNRDQIMRHA